MADKFLEILFPDELQSGDLDILVEATADQPGQARLAAANIGQPDPDAPQSVPLFSQTRAKIGFVATEFLMPPFNTTYLIVEADNGA